MISSSILRVRICICDSRIRD